MSAAKLRKFGRGSAIVASTALVMTSFGPAAFAAWDDAPQTPTVTEADQTAGTIGVRDTNATLENNQGATLVQAGQNDQAIADTMITLPNRFKAGDVIELHLLDRQVSEENDYRFNSGPSMAVGFSGTPTVATDAAPKSATAQISRDSDVTTPLAAWEAAAGPTAVKPGVAPAFSVSTRSSNGGPGQNVLRLTVTSEASTGDVNGRWLVNLSDLKVNLGSAVTPGALRLVPFSINADGNATEWFCGNTRYSNNDTTTPADDTPREIGIYTVPAYVSPARIAATNTDVVADGTAQSIGDLTVTETQGYSLGNGDYTLTLSGATIANANVSDIKVAVTNGGTNETATVTAIAADDKSLTLRLANTDPTKASTYTISGLMLQSSAPQPIRWSLGGDYIEDFMATAGGAGEVTDAAGDVLVRDDASFLSETGAEPYNTVVDDDANTVGAELTQQEAGKFDPQTVDVTFADPDYTVTNDADDPVTNLDDTLVTLTPEMLTQLGGAGDYTVTVNEPVVQNTVVPDDPATPENENSVGAVLSPGEANQLPAADAEYTVTYTPPADADALPRWEFTVDADTWASTDGRNFYNETTVPGTLELTFSAALLPTSGVFSIANETTVADNPYVLVGPNGETYTSDDGITFTDADPATADVVLSATAVDAGTFTVTNATATPWTFTADMVGTDGEIVSGTYTSTDGVTFAQTPANATDTIPDTVTFNTALEPVSGEFTIVENDAEAACGVWQQDILAPLGDLTTTGSSSAGLSAVGGNNRFETARKIAKLYSPQGEYAIIASGANFPDALSSGFLSQKLGAPILLTDKVGQAIPQDTMESLRERGVRKVYIVGGPAAVSPEVESTLADTSAYMWSDSANNLVPRGNDLEVVRLGGDSRFTTNQIVNMYAAAQGTGTPVVGQTATTYGQPLKTTAMIARADDFADALTANVLTSGRNAGFNVLDATEATKALLNAPAGVTLTQADINRLNAGTYTYADGVLRDLAGGQVATSTNGSVFTLDAGGTITFNTPLAANQTFTITETAASVGTRFDVLVATRNALPVILTDKDGLNPAASKSLQDLHIQHTLLIGSENAVSESVDSSIKALKNAGGVDLGITTRRLGGTDRYDTAKVVNEYAMTPMTASPTNTAPGLGFDGGKLVAEGGTVVGGEWEAFLANGGVTLVNGAEQRDPLKFADALVAGPWVSARRDAMPLVGVVTTPDPTTAFYTENAERLDRAIGLGLGEAVSTKVIEFANRLVSAK